jgi:hypothetical protein
MLSPLEIVEDELKEFEEEFWKGGNCKYELFILKQIVFHHLLIYVVHHLLWL